MSVRPGARAYDAAQLWARRGPDVVWERAPGEGAVFDPATGETHFLNELPALILSVMDADWAAYQDLVARLDGPTDLDDQAHAQILAALVFLEGAELVESRPPGAE